MTSRIGKPDTPADIEIRERLDKDGIRHFIMIAGAGSGKTTSLIKALNYLQETRGDKMLGFGQKIACITYTDIAVEEISNDVGHNPLFHVSTIHSFLWSMIKPFQSDLHSWVKNRLLEKITISEEKIAKPRTRETTKEKERSNIKRYTNQLEDIKLIKNFTYNTGSDYSKGILGHSDILKLGPSLINQYELMRAVVVQRFPVIFIDESQDTLKDFIESLKTLADNTSKEFCIGFFGDPMQKIYLTGIGKIDSDEGWGVIKKPENFRCPKNVLDVINNIRKEGDGLHQTRGRMIDVEGVLTLVQGTARLFILPVDDKRAERLTGVRHWLSEKNKDSLWLSDEKEADVKMLVIVHRMAASRLKFPNLYSSLNDKAPENLSTGLIDGTAWVIRPFLRYILPLVKAYRENDEFLVINLLRKYCPRLYSENIISQDIKSELEQIKDCVSHISDMLIKSNNFKIGDIINFIADNNFAELDERYDQALFNYRDKIDVIEDLPENSALRFLMCQTNELWGYQKYIESLSPFSTQQGIKGAEFERVLVVIDDEENTGTSFSYGKYFGLIPLSDRDKNNISDKKDSVIDRTRRLFYVCCSRAVKDLAVVVFSDDIKTTYEVISKKGYFPKDNIICLDDKII